MIQHDLGPDAVPPPTRRTIEHLPDAEQTFSARFVAVDAAVASPFAIRRAVAVCLLLLIGVGCQGRSSPAQPGSRIDPSQPAAAHVNQEELLAGIQTHHPPDTPESLRRKKVEVEQKIQAAREAIAAEDWGSAVTALDRALYLDYKNHTAKLLIVKALHARSLAAEAADPPDQHGAGMDIRNAGVYLTHLLNENDEFTKEERQLFAQVYFDEARVYGRTIHRQDEFSTALKNAIDAGYSDVERLKTEPDFEQFRAHPDTARLLESTIESLEANSGDSPAPTDGGPEADAAADPAT